MAQTLYLGGTAFSNVTVGGTTVTAVYVGSTKIWEAGSSWTDPDLANASYDSVSFSVAGQDTTPQCLFFKPDGTKLYILGDAGNEVNEYDLSTAWDISSASYVQVFSTGNQDTSPLGFTFSPDGTKMYVAGNIGNDVNEYDLSTAWNISTASYLQNFSVASQETIPSGIFFKPDGTKMYVIGYGSDSVNEYDLRTAWDVSTASYSQNFSVASQETLPAALFFSPTGLSMYVLGVTGDDVNEYDLSTAWDVSTASYVQNFSVSSQDTTPLGLYFKSDGSKMYMVGAGSDTIYQYST